jgi:hypothetical protein
MDAVSLSNTRIQRIFQNHKNLRKNGPILQIIEKCIFASVANSWQDLAANFIGAFKALLLYLYCNFVTFIVFVFKRRYHFNKLNFATFVNSYWFNLDFCRAGHFRYVYRSSDIRYLSDTEKMIEISDFKSIGRSNIGPPNFDFR